MIELNQQQIAMAMRLALGVGGPLAALIMAKTGMSEGDYTLYLNAALAVVPPIGALVWGWFANRKATQVANVEHMPEVATIVVKDGANGALGLMAATANNAHPNIVTETQNEADAKKGTKV
jgi:hypothetical protein